MDDAAKPFDGVETQSGPNPVATVIFLHGLGADGHDFAPVVPQLAQFGLPSLRWLLPHAPVRPVTINRGAAMRAWYDIRGISIEDKQDEAGVRESVARIDALIDAEVGRGVPASRILLGGFSQGGAIALSAGLRRQDSLAGIVALSTYLPLAETLDDEITQAGRSTPVFMAHGSRDGVVPQQLGAWSRDEMQRHGVAVDWSSWPMAHEVCGGELAALAAFVGKCLARTAA